MVRRSEGGQTQPADGSPEQKPRLLSLDAFRGLDIALMVFVNMTWDRDVFHRQFFHVGWNEGRMGVTVTDLVFPWFLFIAGAAIPWSMASGRGAGHSNLYRVFTAFRRGLVIYTLGTLLSAARSEQFQFLTLDILQFIGIAYFIGVCVSLLPRWVQIAFVVVVLAGKYIVMHHIPHPDHGRVFLEQRDNLREWITAYDFGLGDVNRVPQWLANGLFNILPGSTVVVMGAFAGGRLLRAWKAERDPSVTRTLLLWGLGVWAASFALRFVDPSSKDFFTASYALLAAGTGTALLAAFYWVIDVRRWTTLFWARVFGLNALAFYVANEALFRVVLTRWTQPWVTNDAGAPMTLIELMRWAPVAAAQSVLGDTHAALVTGRWVFVLAYMLAWWVVFWWLYRKRWFWKV
ncbi:MAG: heparan-alpha-glucosaminide N-acetyltransferase domain-containing protein [Planctomycetota bacterium]